MGFTLASRTFPGFSSLYLLGEAGRSNHFRADIGLPEGQDFAATRGEIRPAEPVPASWMMGRSTPADVIWTGSAAPVIVSDRAVSILEAEGFDGWGTYNVALSGKSGETIQGYSGLVVHGRCGEIDHERSIKFDKIMPGGVFPWWRGLYFDPATWDGSDLFMPAGTVGWIFVVEAVKRALEIAKVKNVVFTPLDQVERMTP